MGQKSKLGRLLPTLVAVLMLVAGCVTVDGSTTTTESATPKDVKAGASDQTAPAANRLPVAATMERWTCGDTACNPLFGLGAYAECNKLSLTADIADGTGTVRFDTLPMHNADFWISGFSRVWAWTVSHPARDKAEYFEISPDYEGSYFPEGLAPISPVHKFYRRRKGSAA